MKILRHLTLALLIIGVGVVIVELTVALKRSETSWWALGAPALGAYLILLLGLLFRGDGNPLSRAMDASVRFLTDRPLVGGLAAVLIWGVAVALGASLYATRDAPDGVYRVLAYSGINVPDNRIPGLVVVFEVQAPDHHRATWRKPTSPDGIVEFATHLNDLVTVRVVDQQGRYYVLETKSIKEADLVTDRPFDMAAIPNEEWRSPTAEAPLGAQISWIYVDASYFRPKPGAPQRKLGTAAGLETLAPLGPLPAAEVLVSRDPYVIGFNPAWRQPRWVAYEIRGQGEGVHRTPGFRADPLVPRQWQARDSDYRGSGYDRGGMLATRDSAVTQEVEAQLRYFTVLSPAASRFNRTIFARLKQHASDLRNPDGSNRVFVIRGPAFVDRGGGDAHRFLTIGAGKLPVPTHFFQIAAVLDRNGLTLDCALVPNLKSFDEEPGRGMPPEERYRAGRAEIERATGLRFLSGVTVDEERCR